MTLSITPEPFDAPSSQELIAALSAELNVRYGDEDDLYLFEVEAHEVSPPLGIFLVARIDGEPVGCGALRRLAGRAGHGEVKRMFVSPAARGAGLGRLLLEALEAHAPALGFRVLRLETGDAQPEAVALYRSAGWTEIAGYGRFADEVRSICFAKDIGTR